MQAGIMDVLAQNFLLAVGMFFILFVVFSVIFFKLVLRIVYGGYTYRYYNKKGRLMREDKIERLIIPFSFLGYLEIIPPPRQTAEDTTDYLEDNESD